MFDQKTLESIIKLSYELIALEEGIGCFMDYEEFLYSIGKDEKFLKMVDKYGAHDYDPMMFPTVVMVFEPKPVYDDAEKQLVMSTEMYFEYETFFEKISRLNADKTSRGKCFLSVIHKP